ncbi:MAG: twin-arginine translocation signal domain-containing protein, partial [Bryobacterales bacterium]|nr:twin-arginine translocation signal domain-containing protein [Bryobacterales bacterium]
MNRRTFISGAAAVGAAGAASSPQGDRLRLENEHFALAFDPETGAITSLQVKRNRAELIGEQRLAANFRICLPLPDYLCNYIEGTRQRPVSIRPEGNAVTIRFEQMASARGKFPLDLSCTIALDGDAIRFRANLRNRSPYPVSEFWFPRIGGWTGFGRRDALLASPAYRRSCRHDRPIFRRFPGTRGFGSEAAEMTEDYPGLTMPWW